MSAAHLGRFTCSAHSFLLQGRAVHGGTGAQPHMGVQVAAADVVVVWLVLSLGTVLGRTLHMNAAWAHVSSIARQWAGAAT